MILSTPTDGTSKRFKQGDKVFGSSQGAFATQICVQEMDLQPMPEGWTFNEAAALYLTGPTAHAAIDLRARTQAGKLCRHLPSEIPNSKTELKITELANIFQGDWALIHGAAGGVGLSAIQFAKARGAKVIATATTPRNIAVCKSFGADHVIDYAATPAWEKEIMKITSGHGVDVVFDPVGTISQSMKCAAFDARIVTIGFVGGQIEAIKVNRILLKNIAVVGLHWGAYREFAPEMIPKVWEGLFKLIGEGKYRSTTFEADGVKPFVGLKDLARALKLLEDKESWGKVVVDVSGDAKARL